jgi:hypothetical protein
VIQTANANIRSREAKQDSARFRKAGVERIGNLSVILEPSSSIFELHQRLSEERRSKTTELI